MTWGLHDDHMIKAKHPFSNNGINQVHLIDGVWEYNISIQWASLNIFHACKTGTCMRKWRTSFLDTPARYRTFPRKSRRGQKHSQLYPHKRTWTPTNAYVSAQRILQPTRVRCSESGHPVKNDGQKVPELGPTFIHYHLHVSVSKCVRNADIIYSISFFSATSVIHFCLHSKWPNCPFELPGQWVGSEIQTVLSIGMTNLWIRT